MIQAIAFALTLIIELPVAAVVGWARRVNVSLPRLLVVSACGTLLTHPFVWAMVSNWLRPWPFWGRTAVAETFAVVVEALVYWRGGPVSGVDAALLSLLANGASFGLGLLLQGSIYDLARFIHG